MFCICVSVSVGGCGISVEEDSSREARERGEYDDFACSNVPAAAAMDVMRVFQRDCQISLWYHQSGTVAVPSPEYLLLCGGRSKELLVKLGYGETCARLLLSGMLFLCDEES